MPLRSAGAPQRAATPDARGSSSSAALHARTPAGAEEVPGSLESTNIRLRHELQACREQLAAAVFGPIPGGPPEASSSSSAWLAAQLAQSQRQVQVLCEALVARSDVSIELEAVLLQLRQPAPDGTQSEAAVWAANALKRLRGVQWVESIAKDVVDRVAALPTPTQAGSLSRSSSIAKNSSERHISQPTAAQRSLVADIPPARAPTQRMVPSGRSSTGASTGSPAAAFRSRMR